MDPAARRSRSGLAVSPLEVLDLPLVLLRGFARVECAEVAALPGLGVDLP